MPTYIYDRETWPKFHWAHADLAGPLASVRHRQGRLIGRMESVGAALRSEANLRTLTEDVVKSSAIDGDALGEAQVRACLARRLDLTIEGLGPTDRQVEGMAEVILDATQRHGTPLTTARLLDWHAALSPTPASQTPARTWRTDGTGPTCLVSGPAGRQRVQYRAPPADRLDREIETFLAWFNGNDGGDPVIKAGVAHLWFVTIRPFDHSNGRLARAIADMVLARSEHGPQRFYSMSAEIRRQRTAYFATLQTTQGGELDITPWLDWFLACLGHAIDNAEGPLGTLLQKARFWEAHPGVPINARQRAVLDHLLEGVEGRLTSSKWARLANCSQDTALRDIDHLLNQGVLSKGGAGGRSTNYSLA